MVMRRESIRSRIACDTSRRRRQEVFEMTVNDVAERIRSTVVEVAIRAYEDAGVQGLCAEGRWEAAVNAMRSLDLAPAVERARPTASGRQATP